MLAFNSPSRFIVYKGLVQGLNRSVSACASLILDYLDLVVKVDQCAQYRDDNGNANKIATDLTLNIRSIFECLRKTELKLTVGKFDSDVRKAEFFRRTISPEELSAWTHKIQIFLNKIPRVKNSYAALSRFRRKLQNLYSLDGWKIQPILHVTESRNLNQHNLRTQGNLWFSQQIAQRRLRNCT